MNNSGGLLFHRPDWNEAHRGAADRFADRGGVGGIGLVTAKVSLDVGRWDQADIVAKPGEFAGPVMGGATGFHADKAGRQFGEPFQQLGPAQRPVKHHLFLSIHGMDLENTFGEVKADTGNSMHGWLRSVGVDDLNLGTMMP